MSKQYAHRLKDGDRVVKVRTHAWYDAHKGIPMFGAQVKLKGQAHRFYQHIVDLSGNPMLFEQERDAQMLVNSIAKEFGE